LGFAASFAAQVEKIVKENTHNTASESRT